MNQSKYLAYLKQLSKKPVFTSKEGREAGIPSRMLAYFCLKGQIERMSKGIYRVKEFGLENFEWEDLALTAMSVSKGAVCLISALCYYHLTDEIMRENWIAIPHSSTAPKRESIRVVRMRNMTLGKTEVEIDGYHLNMFDRERTVVDAFRYLDKEIALKALKAYLESNGEFRPDIHKLLKYGKILRVDLTPYIMAFTL